MLEKVGQWLDAGARLVWLLDQTRRDARIYRADGTVSILQVDDELDGEDVLPRFRCPLHDIPPNGAEFEPGQTSGYAARRWKQRLSA